MPKDFPGGRMMGDMIIYPKRGWEPPPPIEGYERDPKDKWRFILKILPCSFRMKAMGRRKCGALFIKFFCKCEDCIFHKKQVTRSICDRCEFRQ